MLKRFISCVMTALMLITLVPALPVSAATEDTAFIINAAGSTSVSYYSCNDGYPGTNHRVIDGANYAHGYGELGCAPLTDVTGTFTIPQDGTYQFELKGGGGAAAFLDCAGGRCAIGGEGGHLIANIPLKKGDVVKYVAASGGIQASYGHSVAYDGRNADVTIGANGRDSIVYINGVEYLRARGGHGAYRFCQQGNDYAWCENLLKSEGNFNGAYKRHYPSDDPAIGGLGGSCSVASGRGISVVKNVTGANGQATVLSGLSVSVGQQGLSKQKWYAAAANYSKDQTPGFVLMSLNHTHSWVKADSACTEAGTINRYCTICKGTAYGTVTTPAHGHNFQPVEVGTEGYECNQGQIYYPSNSNSASNKTTAIWGGKPNYWWTYQCSYCKAMSKPIYAYKVRYNENKGGALLDPDWKYENKTYTPYTQEDTGWSRDGYYIAYWKYTVNGRTFSTQDPDWPVGKDGIEQYLKNIPAKGEPIVDLHAIWKPIPYTIRIHENYQGRDSYKDFLVYYGQSFRLPEALWDHNAMVMGYDFEGNTYVTPEYSVGSQLKNLTLERNAIIDIYTIWDAAPVVNLSTNELHLNMEQARTWGIALNDNTISKSELELKLMTYASATDYEWSARTSDDRYPGITGNIKPGENAGYKFSVVSLQPGKLQDSDTYTLYATFECVDDSGQVGRNTMTIFFSGVVDILTR